MTQYFNAILFNFKEDKMWRDGTGKNLHCRPTPFPTSTRTQGARALDPRWARHRLFLVPTPQYRTNPMRMPPQLRSVVPSGLQLYAVKKKPTYLSLYIYRCTCSTYRISMIKGTDAIQQNKQFMHKWMWVYICLWLSEIIRESIKEASNGRTSQLCHIWRVINFRMYVCLSVCWSGYTLWWK